MNKAIFPLKILIFFILAGSVFAQEAGDDSDSVTSETATSQTPAVGNSLENKQETNIDGPPSSENSEVVPTDDSTPSVIPGVTPLLEEEESAGFIVDFYRGIKTLLVLGGPVVWILLVVSILGLTLALTKFLQFSRTNVVAIKVIDDAISLWLEGNIAKGSGNLERSAIPIAADIKYGLEMRGTLDQESLQDEMIRRSSSFLREYSHNLKPLELIYYLAPVMGLLGTVLGMIDAFRGLAVTAGAAGESSALASGIWEALLTTAVGLSIAIPFAVMHAILETKLDTLTEQVGDMITRVCSRNEVS
ncbi:MAG: MotA/TolQ/ExbB proton channel family protein [Pseudomonadota bacterium]|nr:MotA/TolQ/ExbB proton channel family protein [Pseudomonadota bacterium]